MTRVERLEKANALLAVIATVGRRFFHTERRCAVLALVESGGRQRVVFIDDYSCKVIPVWHSRCDWRGFSHGGTMRTLVKRLARFVMQGVQLPISDFGPWPEWVCGGDLWGYGKDMRLVRNAVVQLGIAQPAPAAAMDAFEKDGAK